MTGDSNTEEEKSAEDIKADALESAIKPDENKKPSETDAVEGNASVEDVKKDSIKIQPKSKNKSKILLWLPAVVVFGVVVTLAYFSWQQWQAYQLKQQEQQQRLANLEQETANQRKTIENLLEQQDKQVGSQGEQLKRIQQRQSSIQQRLDSHNQRLRSLSGTSREDWLLAEARYLLRLASQRLLVSNGTEGAQALLQAADNILDGIDDNELLPVRTSIANEIIELRLAKTVDKPGLYARLNALKKQMRALPSVPYRMKLQEKALSDSAEGDANTSWQPWNSIVSAFSDVQEYIKVTKHDEIPDLLYSEQQQQQIRNNLLLMLEQAQFALLHEEEEIYRISLSQVLQWWNTHFIHYEQQDVLSAEIKTLLNENIVAQLPSIRRSAELLSDYIDRFHAITPAVSSGQKEVQ